MAIMPVLNPIHRVETMSPFQAQCAVLVGRLVDADASSISLWLSLPYLGNIHRTTGGFPVLVTPIHAALTAETQTKAARLCPPLPTGGNGEGTQYTRIKALGESGENQHIC